MLSFTSNRLINRPNKPRDGKLLQFLKDIGYEWPQDADEEDTQGDENEDVEEVGGCEGGEASESEVEFEDDKCEDVEKEGGGHNCLLSMSFCLQAVPHQC